MCFKTKDGAKILLSRRFRYQSGHYYLSIKKNKNVDRLLVMDIDYVEGQLDFVFVIIDKENNEEIKKDVKETTHYEFNVLKDHEYKIIIHTKKAIGGYQIALKQL